MDVANQSNISDKIQNLPDVSESINKALSVLFYRFFFNIIRNTIQ
jgi:hypothetical protein